MNLYFLVEGRRTEKKVYQSWISQVFSDLKKADLISEVRRDNYRLFSIEGNTDRVDNIERALAEINRHNSSAAEEGREPFDHLFICLDAEDVGFEIRLAQIESLVAGKVEPTHCHAIVHCCCIETWFLGNRKMMKRNPQSERLRRWKEFYDVSVNCPESMECHSDFRVKAEFHLEYLKEMLRERGLSYSKYKPNVVLKNTYLRALVGRYEKTGHLQSFGRLVTVWRALNGNI